MSLRHLIAIPALLLLPLAARATGAHDLVGCNGCHAQKDVMAGNKKLLDPATNQPFAGSTGVCLACHATREEGGKGFAPVSQKHSHPFALAAVNPRRAKVSANHLMTDGGFGCMSCHDPHPSNGNYKYLRVDIGPKGQNMDRFCAECHPAKAG